MENRLPGTLWTNVKSSKRAELTFLSALNQKKMISVFIFEERYLALTNLTLPTYSMVSHQQILSAALWSR